MSSSPQRSSVSRRCRRSTSSSPRPRRTCSPSTPSPNDHWPKLRSTNPLERVNREIGRRTDVVGIFPNDRSLIRLAASVVIEQNDEWLVGHRYLSQHSLDAILTDFNKDNNNRRHASSPQHEQPTSYTTPRDLTRITWVAERASRFDASFSPERPE